MGLFSKKQDCCVCGSHDADKQIRDGFICKNCRNKSRIITFNWKDITKDRIIKCFEASEVNEERKKIFSPDRKIEGYLLVDSANQLWQIPAYNEIFSYDDFVEFDVIEDGSSITKGGLGRAVAGAALFGGVGAIVGGVTGGKKTKNVMNELRIKFVTRSPIFPEIYINILTNGNVKAGSLMYNSYKGILQRILTELALMNDSLSNHQPKESGADEIMKYKNLLDMGAITQEEYDAKKKQILGI